MRALSAAVFLAFLAAGLLYPLLRILALGAGPEGLGLLQDPYYWQRLAFSFTYGLAAALAVAFLSLPIAYGLVLGFPGRAAWVALASVPFVLPTIVVAAAFLALVGPKGALGVDLTGSFLVLLWAAVFYNLGFAARILHGLLPRAGGEAFAAARSLGASPFRAFLRVSLPALFPGLLTAGILTFVFTFASFGVPLLLGGYRYSTLEVEIYRLLAYELDFKGAAALVLWQAVVLTSVSLLYLLAARRLGAEGQAQSPGPAEGGYLRGAVFWLFLLFIYAPLIALIYASFKTPEGLGLDHYLAVLTSGDAYFRPGLLVALKNTLLFGIGAALLALLPGVAYATLAARGGVLTELLGLLPLVVSPVSLGVGYLLAYPHLKAHPLSLVLIYATLGFPLLARALVPALRSLGGELAAAAATLGAAPWRRLVRVELPLALPALASGAALALAVAIGEFGATLLLFRPEWTTLTLAIYERLSRPGLANYGEAMALSVVLAVVSGTLFFLLARRAEIA